MSVCQGPVGRSALCSWPPPVQVMRFKPSSCRIVSAVSNGGATTRDVSPLASRIFTVVDALASVAPPLRLLRVTMKLVLFETDPFRKMGMGMVLTVSFWLNARVPDTAS